MISVHNLNSQEENMPQNQAPETDKGYILMHEIEANSDISQRELSHKTGLSLGTVNLLLQKMIKQGLIKMETIPANRVIYMLTPKGMAEKAVKTVQYIRNHYRIIQETKDMIRGKLSLYHEKYDVILICRPGNELDNLVEVAVDEYRAQHPGRIVRSISEMQMLHPDRLSVTERTVILYLPEEASGRKPLLAALPAIHTASLLDVPV
jgi:DNA-binding MarR family transcriptional regulator